MSNTIENVTKWIKMALGTDKCSVLIEVSNAVGEGYTSDVSFVTVDKEEEDKELYLVVKTCKNDPRMRKISQLNRKKEILAYEEILPPLLNFQKHKTVVEPFTALPKCYKAFTDGDIDVIILENLKKKGFVKLPRKSVFDVEHIKLILKNYAKFHALSFALNEQRRDISEKIEKKCHFLLTDLQGAYEKGEPKVMKNLKEAGRPDLAEKYEKLMKKGAMKMINDAYSDVPKERVIGHGSCHSSNILFKYKDEHNANLQEMILIDFKLVKMHSPILDLACLFHFTASKAGLTHFKELMEYYHQELTSFLAELGTDVNEVFPQSAMWEHWAKYRIKSFLDACTFSELLYTDYLSNLPEAVNNDIHLDGQIRAEYLDRLVAVADFYLNNDIYKHGNVVTL